MARTVTTQRRIINTAVAWGIGLLIFFPVLWTILTSFKTEAQAIADPPVFLFFDWTLENYSIVQERSDYMRFLWNSVIIAGVSTLLGILVAVPAAWSMAFVPSKRTKDVLLWMLSTKMLPAVGVLYPIYLIFIELGLLDTRTGLVLVMMLINLPIIVWMLYTYFREIPGEILEAARMDGASLREEILYVLTIHALFRKVQHEEIIPHVKPVPDMTPEACLDLITRRFSNPAIVDTTRRVTFEGSSRHTGFVLPILRDGLRTGAPVEGLALVEALWARMCDGTREDGSVIEPNDPLWDTLQAAAKAAREHPRVWLEQRRFYGDLVEAPRFAEAFERWLDRIWSDGCEAALQAYAVA